MYCQPTDLEKLVSAELLGQLADDGPGATATPDQIIAEAIDQADGEIDGYVGVVLPVPLSPAPRLVANLSAKIAAYNLFRRRPHLEAGEWKEEYARALRLLERIARGEISMGPKEGETAAALEPNGLAVVTKASHFGDLEDF